MSEVCLVKSKELETNLPGIRWKPNRGILINHKNNENQRHQNGHRDNRNKGASDQDFGQWNGNRRQGSGLSKEERDLSNGMQNMNLNGKGHHRGGQNQNENHNRGGGQREGSFHDGVYHQGFQGNHQNQFNDYHNQNQYNGNRGQYNGDQRSSRGNNENGFGKKQGQGRSNQGQGGQNQSGRGSHNQKSLANPPGKPVWQE